MVLFIINFNSRIKRYNKSNTILTISITLCGFRLKEWFFFFLEDGNK